MPKNRVLLIGLSLLMAACVVVVYLLPPKSRVSKENFERIEVGMSHEDVETILGGTSLPLLHQRLPDGMEDVWENEDGDMIGVGFDASGRVKTTSFLQGPPDPRTMWEKLLDRMPWRRDEAAVGKEMRMNLHRVRRLLERDLKADRLRRDQEL